MTRMYRRAQSVVLILAARIILAVTRRLDLVVLRRDQLQAVLVLLALEEARLRRMGGGNASKVRDPRKSLRRLVQRLGVSLSHVANRATPLDPPVSGPRALRDAARRQIMGVSDA
jgi:hypothetical protein